MALVKLTAEHEAARALTEEATARANGAEEQLHKALDSGQALNLKVRPCAARVCVPRRWAVCGAAADVLTVNTLLDVSCVWVQLESNEAAMVLLRTELNGMNQRIADIQVCYWTTAFALVDTSHATVSVWRTPT
jgi:hypothetical protein